MIYGLGYTQKSIDNRNEFIITKHISKEDFDKHNKNMEFCRYYSHLKEVYLLIESNVKSLLEYMDLVNDNEKTKSIKDEQVVLEENRLLINYLTSLGIFIDYGKKEMGEALGKSASEQFLKKTNELYDNHISYRFLVLMRNYAVHYSFPLHIYIKSLVSPSGLFADRNILLRFSGWKHAKADIQKMPETIKIEPHVINMQKYIRELFNYCLFMFSSKLVDVIQYANDLVKSSNHKRPAFAKFESEEKFRAGEITLVLVDLGVVISALKDLQSHPNIKIEDNSENKMENRLEFYYNDSLIMAGPISYFKQIMTNPTNPNENMIKLELGDCFTLDEFPQTGVSTKVRVMRIRKLYNQLNGQPDTIKYYIEPCSE